MTRRITKIILSISVFFTLSVGCNSDTGDDPIPYIPFANIVINLGLPTYNALRIDGGFMTIDGGIRGIILYRANQTTYRAFERNCSFQPNQACATVDVDFSGLYMFDPCCSSSFSFTNGYPSGGVAWRPLRQYRTYYNAGELTITDEVIN